MHMSMLYVLYALDSTITRQRQTATWGCSHCLCTTRMCGRMRCRRSSSHTLVHDTMQRSYGRAEAEMPSMHESGCALSMGRHRRWAGRHHGSLANVWGGWYTGVGGFTHRCAVLFTSCRMSGCVCVWGGGNPYCGAGGCCPPKLNPPPPALPPKLNVCAPAGGAPNW